MALDGGDGIARVCRLVRQGVEANLAALEKAMIDVQDIAKKLDTDAPAGSVKAFLDSNREANRMECV